MDLLIMFSFHASGRHELFGDPDADYQAALDRHYREAPPAGWQENYER
jgi:hypothetical protein